MAIKFYQKIIIAAGLLPLLSLQTIRAWSIFGPKVTKSEIKREFLFSPHGTLSIENLNLWPAENDISLSIRSNGKIVMNGKTFNSGKEMHVKGPRLIINGKEYSTSDNKPNAIIIEGHDSNTLDLVIETEGYGDLSDVHTDIAIDYNHATIRTWYNDNASKTSRQYKIKVPKNVYIKMLQTNQGSIQVCNIEGTLEKAETILGDIHLKHLNGFSAAQTINGDIFLESLKGDVYAQTHTGSITMRLGNAPHAALQASSVSGTCTSDILVKGIKEKKKITGIIGLGGTLKKLATLSGDIILKK